MHIGKMVREVLKERQMTVVSFAERLSCTRENAHRILNKANMDTGLLMKISGILDFDFFSEISKCGDFGHSDKIIHTKNT